MVTAAQKRMDAAVMVARFYDVPVECVMPAAMLHNWRRRTKRLERAILRASGPRRVDNARLSVLLQARRRLHTGRLTP